MKRGLQGRSAGSVIKAQERFKTGDKLEAFCAEVFLFEAMGLRRPADRPAADAGGCRKTVSVLLVVILVASPSPGGRKTRAKVSATERQMKRGEVATSVGYNKPVDLKG